jgi:hypothetical protein
VAIDNKDNLKALAYRWDENTKCWNLMTTHDHLEEDLVNLKEAGFNGQPARVQVETLDGLVKYSQRPGEKNLRSI